MSKIPPSIPPPSKKKAQRRLVKAGPIWTLLWDGGGIEVRTFEFRDRPGDHFKMTEASVGRCTPHTAAETST